MGLGPEYSLRRLCEMTDCERGVAWTVHVQWSLVDFLDVECCDDHVPFTIDYWQRFNVDGVGPEVWADEIIPW